MRVAALPLEANEVHTLAVRLNLARLPDSTVRGRAELRSQKARAATCAVLARYLGVRAAEIRLTIGRYGKPELAVRSSLRFNVSHSGNLLVLAIAHDVEVGVDVEHVRPMPGALALARRFFRAEEADVLERVASEEIDRAFFHGWTQKEAYLKAIGTGLHTDPRSFSVCCDPDRPGALHWISNEDAACWSMHTWEPAAQYRAALAMRDLTRHVRELPLLHEAELGNT